MDFTALERLFYQRHPQGSFLTTSIKKVSAIKVQFDPGGLTYTYKGSAEAIAQEMKLVGIERDLEGQAKLPKPVDGKYQCHVNLARDRWRVWVLSVTSPFTGQTLTIREGYKHLLSDLWEAVAQRVRQDGKKAGVNAGASHWLTVEELKAVKAIYDQQQSAIAAMGRPLEPS